MSTTKVSDEVAGDVSRRRRRYKRLTRSVRPDVGCGIGQQLIAVEATARLVPTAADTRSPYSSDLVDVLTLPTPAAILFRIRFQKLSAIGR